MRASALILALSSLAAVFFWYAGGVQVPGGSYMFFQWAQAISTGDTLSPQVAQRDIGFPLLIWLSGYSLTGSVLGILIVYALFGALMPLLVYWTLRPFSPQIAWMSGLVAILSVGPYFFAKMFYHDQACIFFMTLTMCWFALFLVRERYSWLCLFTIAATFTSLTRPAMNLIFPLLWFAALAFGPRPRRLLPYTISLSAFIVTLALYQAYRFEAFDVTSLKETPSYAGEQVFYNAYINASDYGVQLDLELGPAMRETFAKVREAISPSPAASPAIKLLLTTEPKDFWPNFLLPTSDQLFDRIWKEPNYEYMTFIDQVVDDRTLFRAAMEIIKRHPRYFATYTLRGATHYLFSPGYGHTRFSTQGYVKMGAGRFYPAETDLTELPLFPARAQLELRQPPSYQYLMSRIAALWFASYDSFIRITSGLMIVGWLVVLAVPIFSRAFVGCFAAATALLLYNALLQGAFADADYRYEAMVIVLRVTIAGFGLIALISPRMSPFLRSGASAIAYLGR